MSSRASSSPSSVMPSPTPNTPSARPSPPLMSSTPSSARAVPCTVSVAKRSQAKSLFLGRSSADIKLLAGMVINRVFLCLCAMV